MNRLSFLSFFTVFLSIYFFIHYFVYFRIVKGFDLSIVPKILLAIFLLLSSIQLFIDRSLTRHNIINPLGRYGYFWLGIISIAFSLFVLEYLASNILPRHSKLITMITLSLIFILSCVAIFRARLPLKVKRIQIPVKGLSSESKGFSIVQLSDLHLDSSKPQKWLEDIVEKTNGLRPDIVVITGDLLDRDVDGKSAFGKILRGLSPRHGVFAVPGNHEYYTGIDAFNEFCKMSGIKVLFNENIIINREIELAGIVDDTGKMFKGNGPDLHLALKRCDPNKPTVLLSHRPKYFKEAVEMGVDLQLSGHTHAGQIPPMEFIIHLIYRYPYGLYKKDSSFIYTTCGTGIWGPPMRLFSRSEIVYFDLIRAE